MDPVNLQRKHAVASLPANAIHLPTMPPSPIVSFSSGFFVRARPGAVAVRNPQRKERAMFIQQSDLLRGMDKEFVGAMMDLSAKEELGAGDLVFERGEPARHFYILLKGHVRLSLAEEDRTVHVVSKGGEAFGWSSIAGGQLYSATAKCATPTKLLKFEGMALTRLIELDPENGMVFYKRLAGALGNRLIQSYGTIHGDAVAGSAFSVGTDQFEAVEAM